MFDSGLSSKMALKQDSLDRTVAFLAKRDGIDKVNIQNIELIDLIVKAGNIWF